MVDKMSNRLAVIDMANRLKMPRMFTPPIQATMLMKKRIMVTAKIAVGAPK